MPLAMKRETLHKGVNKMYFRGSFSKSRKQGDVEQKKDQIEDGKK